MSEPPQSWKTCALEDLCDAGKQAIVDGPFGSNLKRSDYRSSGIPVLKIQNIKENQIVIKKMDFVSEVKFRELERHTYTDGDIVMTKLGDPLGVSAIIGGIAPGLIVADLVRIRPTSIDTRFLCYQLNSPFMRAFLNGQQKGTTRPRVNLSMVRGLPISVPPFAEQVRIVAILEEQFSRLDAALASIRTVLEKSKAFRRSLLQAAFEGKLSENGTAGWEIKQLKEVAHVQLGRQRSPQHHHGENMRPYLRAANVTWGGLDLSDVKEMNFTHAELDVFRLLPKDILINEASGSASALGKPAMFRGEIEDCAFQNHLIRVRAKTAVSEYLYWYLLHNALSGAYHSESSGIGILNLGKTRIASWSIPIPPSAVQLQLVQTLDEQFSRLDAALNVANQLEARIASERRSLLHAAFSGTLTTQWRETHNG